MPKLIILFEGLICHVGPSASANIKTHALVVNEPDEHQEPKIRLPTGAPILLQPRDTVTFVNVDGQHARTGSGFDIVPTLRDKVKNGDIKPKALNHTHPVPHKNLAAGAVAAHVIYPKGTLTAIPHSLQVKFTPPDGGTATQQCVPLQVQFMSDDNGGEEFYLTVTHHDVHGDPVGTPEVRRLTSGSLIEVENVSGKGNHFEQYIHITSGDDISKAENANVDCPGSLSLEAAAKVSRKMQKEREYQAERLRKDRGAKAMEEQDFGGPNPECTNSAWP